MPADEAHSSTQRQRLLEQFADQFRVILVRTAEDRERVYSLRHDVFLRELNYALPGSHDANQEHDDFDDQALHCLVEHRASGLAAGCVRLVFPPPDRPDHLPVIDATRHVFSSRELHPQQHQGRDVAEISRLAISRLFRAQAADEDIQLAQFPPEERRAFPLIVTGLFLSAHALAGLTSRRHLYALMEPPLARLLTLSGFRFQPASDTIQYCGVRRAYYIDNDLAERERNPLLDPLYYRLRDALSRQLPAAAEPSHGPGGLWYRSFDCLS
ncbi:PEP-CTERM/exosortase system-associated acyltransferase [Halomonas denitrificans]|uniref:PEP-CTERM/exosortase system-associated acyltransferase n=1 Tax=Halomonas denitrificans TaxID=370769 RepID=UPI001C9945A3|nr:PEP-CTERM/exosortase system-associated acyltransferase [Halomonas denitrificans]MBY5968637.1 PEP-CTERM/exosortase system-associated acyltransferase [Halomonas denitrificans]